MDCQWSGIGLARLTTKLPSSQDTISKATAWIRIPDLPLNYEDQELLLQLASYVGTPFKLNVYTGVVLRGYFAQAFVEVDLIKALTPKAPPVVKEGELTRIYV